MRDYVSGNWGFLLVFGIEASVFPRALVLALPNAIICFVLSTIIQSGEPTKEDSDRAKAAIELLSAFTSVLFFVLYFRSNVAYSRWWEGGTLLQQTRGEWFNAYSSLIAFSSTDPHMVDKVEEFHHLLARLMSMLFCAGLQQVSPDKNCPFEILSTQGVEKESLQFLSESPDKVEVLLQWIQRSTILNMSTGILPIPPPVMSRAFQEISRGIVNLQNARKIADFPFPFPYAQTSIVMLLLHWVTCPIFASMMLDRYLASISVFFAVFFVWCINFIALQLEYPFGEGDNDLPMQQFQRDWNKSVGTLLAKQAQHPPKFDFNPNFHRKLEIVMSDGSSSKKNRITMTPGFWNRDGVSEKRRASHRNSFCPQGLEAIPGADREAPESVISDASADGRSSPGVGPSPRPSVAQDQGAQAPEKEKDALSSAGTETRADSASLHPASTLGAATILEKKELDAATTALEARLESVASPEAAHGGSVVPPPPMEVSEQSLEVQGRILDVPPPPLTLENGRGPTEALPAKEAPDDGLENEEDTDIQFEFDDDDRIPSHGGPVITPQASPERKALVNWQRTVNVRVDGVPMPTLPTPNTGCTVPVHDSGSLYSGEPRYRQRP